MKESFGYLKNKFVIPSCYDDGILLKNGEVMFCYMDSMIICRASGECIESHMGFNGDSHEFFTRSYNQGDEYE